MSGFDLFVLLCAIYLLTFLLSLLISIVPFAIIMGAVGDRVHHSNRYSICAGLTLGACFAALFSALLLDGQKWPIELSHRVRRFLDPFEFALAFGAFGAASGALGGGVYHRIAKRGRRFGAQT